MFSAARVQTLCLMLAVLGLGCDPSPVDPDVNLEPGVELPPATTTATSEGGSATDDGIGGTGAFDDTDTTDEPPTPGTSGADPDSSGGAGGSSDDGDARPPACSDETIQLTVEPPQLILLLDKSRSMVQNEWDHDDDEVTPPVTRWNSLYNVVDQLAHGTEGGIEMGMVLFPSASLTDTNSDTACLVDDEPNAAVGLNNAAAIVEALPAADTLELYGGTPVGRGMTVALEHLDAIADGRSQAIVLVTDGAANCRAGTSGLEVFTEYDDELAPMVGAAFAAGIPTYVIGVDIVDEVGVYPADNPYVRLNELAVAGGVPQPDGIESFYNTTDEEQLMLALDGITATFGCSVELTTPAAFADQVTVFIGGVEIPRVDDCPEDGAGWRYQEQEAPYQSIELCTATCDLAHVEASLDVEYACLPPG